MNIDQPIRRRPVIAVDFDGVIVENRFPDIGLVNHDVVQFLRYLHDNDWYIIVWTCRGGRHLEAVKQFLTEHDIPHDAVNDHAPGRGPEAFGNGPADYGPAIKVAADLYLDDRGCRYAGSIEDALRAARTVEAKRTKKEDHAS